MQKFFSYVDETVRGSQRLVWRTENAPVIRGHGLAPKGHPPCGQYSARLEIIISDQVK
jgi:hypothetical protein